MKKYCINIIFLLCCLFITKSSFAQIDKPVTWQYGAKKLANGIIELHIQAIIQDGWHIYAQKQSKDAIAVPTRITIKKTTGITLIGLPAEIGKKDTYTVKEVGITNYEYAKKVDFVQKVKVKPGIKEVKVTVNWQSCTHERCLPEDSLDFTIPIT